MPYKTLEAQQAHSREYHIKNREKLNAKSKAHHARVKAEAEESPAAKEKLLAIYRERTRKQREAIKADPIKKEKQLQKDREKGRLRYAQNKEKFAAIARSRRAYSREWSKKRRDTNIIAKIESRIRSRITSAIRRQRVKKRVNDKAIKWLGCSFEFFKGYIEAKFTDGMTWAKVMSGEIHLDHIRPVSSYFLLCPMLRDECFNYTNVQPLWKSDNLRKSARLDWQPSEVSHV